MSVVAGGAFHCKDDQLTGDTEHLWVIISDPIAHPNCVIVASVSSNYAARNYDPGCDLNRGDHPSIFHRSFVYYRKALVVTAQQLEAAEIRHTATFSPTVLARIRAGASQNDRLPRYIKKHLVDQGIIGV
jgi:hypothetical protein